jgi:predicted MPP superfamily phosphohydrolase
MRRAATRAALAGVGLLAALVCIVAAIAWRDTNAPRLNTVRIPVVGITRTYRFLQVSDLHSSRFGPKQERLAALVAGRTYDAVLLTGDMLDRQTQDPEPERELIAALAPVSPLVVGVYLDDFAGHFGVVDLEEVSPVRVGEVDLTSLANPAYPRIPDSRDGAVAVVALSHDPPVDDDLRRFRSLEPRLDVLVAGHLHGGQIRLPFAGAIAIPWSADGSDRLWLPETKDVQVRGLELREGVWVVLSNGLGTQAKTRLGALTRFRLLAPAEVTEVVLVPDP